MTANFINTDPLSAKAAIETATQQPASQSETRQTAPQAGVHADDGLGCWGEENDNPRFGPIRVGKNRVVDTFCGTIFMRQNDDRLVWRANTGAPLTDSPKLVNGELVVIGADLHMLGFDPETGVVNWRYDANGRLGYVQLERFGSDQYLVLVDMSGYDDSYSLCGEKYPDSFDRCPRTIPDKLWLLRKNSPQRDWSVPAESKVVVRGTRILVVVRRGKRTKEFEVASLRR